MINSFVESPGLCGFTNAIFDDATSFSAHGMISQSSFHSGRMPRLEWLDRPFVQ
jgi:hypothetical protein